MISKLGVILAIFGLGQLANAQIYSGSPVVPTSLAQALATVKPGTIVVLGEEHDTFEHRNAQIQIIESLQQSGLLTSVGLEFFTFPGQEAVNKWRQGQMTDAELLPKVEWGADPFENYKTQVQLPRLGKEAVLALNAPKFLTSRIAKVGLEGLTEIESSYLPPNFEAGNDAYYARFKALMSQQMGHNLPESSMRRYFLAHSVWDDTMAFVATRFIDENPNQVLVIIVGNFHARYGGGLPDRLKKRGAKSVVNMVLMNANGIGDEDVLHSISPGPDGPMADFVWVTRSTGTPKP